MNLNKQHAVSDQRVEVSMQILWCKKHHLHLAGLPYFDELMGANGIHLQVIAPKSWECPAGTEAVRQAIREGYRERDVVKHSVLYAPDEWFGSAQAEYQRYLAGGKS